MLVDLLIHSPNFFLQTLEKTKHSLRQTFLLCIWYATILCGKIVRDHLSVDFTGNCPCIVATATA